MDYTICSKVIEIAKDGNETTYDLLMPFTSSSNSNRVVLNSHILEQYGMHYNELIRTWVNGIMNRKFYKMVDIEGFQDLFPDTCRLTTDAKFIVREKEDYPAHSYRDITVLDQNEAIIEICPKTVQIVQIGNGNIASAGDNSPITTKP
ncbi:hypothetical protein [Owenweeksia hongkongensis]|uniref:hypothetical protein n=1 Tax=Owenweeksia hongkongensis TaxID=253245 RepID=UPI003A95D81A